MKILFYGDSITDVCRNRELAEHPAALGMGYPFIIAAALAGRHPLEHEIINRGISGNKVVDLYARVKIDVWNHNPDMVSILVGINDVYHELQRSDGVALDRYEKVYRMLVEDTQKALPNAKIVLMEPFVLKTAFTEPEFKRFSEIKKYAKAVKQIAKDCKCIFVPLQKDLDEAAERYGVDYCSKDGIHPVMGGAYIIADRWLKTVFKESL